MRLPDEVQKCVVFLGQEIHDKETGVRKVDYKGTAFFVGVPLRTPNGILLCLVTALHNAEKIGGGEFFIRANTKDGLAKSYPLNGQRWWCHPSDTSVDAAVLLWAPPDEVDFLYIGKNMFLSPETIANKRLGLAPRRAVTTVVPDCNVRSWHIASFAALQHTWPLLGVQRTQIGPEVK